ncbi:MAG: hypothetical protein WAV20_10870, partial [Blastocatellia bacterium]
MKKLLSLILLLAGLLIADNSDASNFGTRPSWVHEENVHRANGSRTESETNLSPNLSPAADKRLTNDAEMASLLSGLQDRLNGLHQ